MLQVLLKILLFILAWSFVLCAICLAYLLAKGVAIVKAISFVVVLLVASIPLAMEVVTTTTMAIGSHELAHKNAIVSRLAAIEELAGMNMLCSDKTGTLTMNKMVIQEDTPTYTAGWTQYEILRMAAFAAKWHEPAKDALDTLVLGQVDMASLEGYEQLDYMPFDPIFKRTEGTVKAPDGEVFKTSKGAPHIIVSLMEDKAVHEAVMTKVNELAERGIRALAVARTFDGTEKWKMLGILTFLDPPRPDTKETLFRAMEFGIDVKMVTGDHAAIAKETCRQLCLGDHILTGNLLPTLDKDGKSPKDLSDVAKQIIEADGFAQVFPEHKFIIVEALKQVGFAVGMTGDGVNDAPALKKADIGIAVQGATDAARAAADIVLTSPGLSVVIDAITISRCIFQRMQSFVLYRVACSLQILVFLFIAVLAFHPEDFATSAPLNVVVGTSDDQWTGANSDGTMVAWHDRECFAYNTPSNLGINANTKNGTVLPGTYFIYTGGVNSSSSPNSAQSLWNYGQTGPGPWVSNGPGGGPFSWYASAKFAPSPAVACYPAAYNSSSGISYYFTGSFDSNATMSGFFNGWACAGPLCQGRWDKFFALPVISLIIITVLNDGTIISIAYDHVTPSKYPEKWNLPVSFTVSGLLGGVACASCILLLSLTLNSHDPNATWVKGFGLPPLSYGNVVAAIYLNVSLADFLTLFCARTTRFFFSIRPGRPLFLAAIVALGLSTTLAATWPFNEANDTVINGFGTGSKAERRARGGVLGAIWIYVAIWWVVQDLLKVGMYTFLEHFDLMGHSTGMFHNIRGKQMDNGVTEDEHKEMAIGLVENKLLAAKIRSSDEMTSTLDGLQAAKLRDSLTAMRLAAASGDTEAVLDFSDEAQKTVSSLSFEDRTKLRTMVMDIKQAAQRAAIAGIVREGVSANTGNNFAPSGVSESDAKELATRRTAMSMYIQPVAGGSRQSTRQSVSSFRDKLDNPQAGNVRNPRSSYKIVTDMRGGIGKPLDLHF